jgi:hypothetical protein
MSDPRAERRRAATSIQAKTLRRKRLRALPYLEKVRILRDLQRMENEIRRASGRPLRPEWPE